VNQLGEPIVANPRTAGTPKFKKINGQELYAGNIPPILRSIMIGQMKDFFRPYFMSVFPIQDNQFPILVELEIHAPVGDNNFDIDNLAWVYTKVILDILVETEVIPDDKAVYVNKSGGCQYFPVETDDDRKMVVIIRENRNPKSLTALKQIKHETIKKRNCISILEY
jgi:hypothetical protein